MHPADLPTVAPAAVADDLLLDVREDDEWAAGHAPSAVHVPLHDLPARLDEVRGAADGRGVAVVCRMGGRSAQATAFLLQHGLAARNVDGGMLAWRAAGLPLVADTGPAQVV